MTREQRVAVLDHSAIKTSPVTSRAEGSSSKASPPKGMDQFSAWASAAFRPASEPDTIEPS
jgi:hypothetical protein